MSVLAPEDGTHTDSIAAYEGNTERLVVEDEGEDTVELVDEVFDSSILFVEVQDDLTVGARLQREVVLGLEVVVVVDLTVADDRQLTASQRLVGSIGDIVDAEALETENAVFRDLLEFHVVGAAALDGV